MTAPLSQPGQRTPSGQRCWRTKAKHLASSSSPERLTRSGAAMMAEAPRASRLATRAPAITPDALRTRYPDPPPRNPTRASGLYRRAVAERLGPAQIGHEGRHIGIGHRRVVPARELVALGQKVIEMAAPPRRVLARA